MSSPLAENERPRGLTVRIKQSCENKLKHRYWTMRLIEINVLEKTETDDRSKSSSSGLLEERGHPTVITTEQAFHFKYDLLFLYQAGSNKVR
ncbi:hypothetical protein SDJN03_04281, partial [Cucurbita argyrosperma subsp. sororia]